MRSSSILTPLLLLVCAGSLLASAALEKGLADGRKFGQEAGAAKGAVDGKAAGDAAGFIKGMEDERTHQPPPANRARPATPPATSAAAAMTLDADTADRLGQTALTRFPDLMPRASVLTTATVESNQDGIEYAKGFALGLAAGFAETYSAAKDAAYQDAYPAGYSRGRAEYKRLYQREDGTAIGPKDQYELGRQAMLLNRYAEAIERFDIAIAAEGATEIVPAALYYKAKAYYDWSKPQDCLETVTKLLTNFADCPYADDATFLQGASFEKSPAAGLGGFFGQRRYPQAKEAYRALTVKFPQSPILADSFFRLGYTSEKTRDKAGAIAAYQAVVERFPDSPLAAQAKVRLQRLQQS